MRTCSADSTSPEPSPLISGQKRLFVRYRLKRKWRRAAADRAIRNVFPKAYVGRAVLLLRFVRVTGNFPPGSCRTFGYLADNPTRNTFVLSRVPIQLARNTCNFWITTGLFDSKTSAWENRAIFSSSDFFTASTTAVHPARPNDFNDYHNRIGQVNTITQELLSLQQS